VSSLADVSGCPDPGSCLRQLGCVKTGTRMDYSELLLTQKALHLAHILAQGASFGGDVQKSPPVPSPVQQHQTSRDKEDQPHGNEHSAPTHETYAGQRRTIEGKKSDGDQGQPAAYNGRAHGYAIGPDDVAWPG
jgi:hypothetical protein